MTIITNMKDLADWLWVDLDRCSADYLSHRMYKGTDCGASISVAIKQEPTTPACRFEADVCKAGDYIDIGLQGSAPEEVRDFLGLTSPEPIVWTTAIEAIDEQSRNTRRFNSYSGWKFKLSYDNLGDKLKVYFDYPAEGDVMWYHNGDNTYLGDKKLYGFSIQTIVEGSDADINGPTFTVPVDTKIVDEWVKEMEDLASQEWERANTLAFTIEKEGYQTAYLRTGGFDTPRWEGQFPFWIKKATRKRIEDHCNDYECDWTHNAQEDQVDGWKIQKIDEWF